MGATTTHKSQINHTYISDNHYGGKVIYKQLTNTVYQQMYLQKRNLQNVLQLLQNRKRIYHPNIISVQSYYTKGEDDQKSYYCHSDHKITLFIQYNYLTRTLQNLIEEYSRKRLQIPQKIIKNILYVIVDALLHLQKNKTCHGDIKPSNILIDQSGEIKIIDSYLINGGKTSYEIVMQNPSSMSLLSPEQLQRIKNKQNQDLNTVYQNQVFSVGLTMLEAMTYEPAMQAYDLMKLCIKPDFPQKKLQQLNSTRYSKNLIQIIMNCIQLKGEYRPTFDQIIKYLKSS